MNLHEIYLALQLAGKGDSSNIDLSDYYTKSQIDALIAEKVDNNALTVINNRLTMLESDSIVTLSQSEYDALSTKVPDTIYMIEETD